MRLDYTFVGSLSQFHLSKNMTIMSYVSIVLMWIIGSIAASVISDLMPEPWGGFFGFSFIYLLIIAYLTVFWMVFWKKIIHVFSFQINVSHNDNNNSGKNDVSGGDGNTSDLEASVDSNDGGNMVNEVTTDLAIGSNNNSSKVIDIKSIELLTRYLVCISVIYVCFIILLVTVMIISLISALNYDAPDDDEKVVFRYGINELLTSIFGVVVVIAIILMFVWAEKLYYICCGSCLNIDSCFKKIVLNQIEKNRMKNNQNKVSKEKMSKLLFN